jgi:hypothetical protein
VVIIKFQVCGAAISAKKTRKPKKKLNPLRNPLTLRNRPQTLLKNPNSTKTLQDCEVPPPSSAPSARPSSAAPSPPSAGSFSGLTTTTVPSAPPSSSPPSPSSSSSPHARDSSSSFATEAVSYLRQTVSSLLLSLQYYHYHYEYSRFVHYSR